MFKGLLASLTDPELKARQICSNTMAMIMPILPLTLDIPYENREEFDHKQARMYVENRVVVLHLVDSGPKNKGFEEDIGEWPKIKLELRKYQREGVCWLDFLRRYGLHGILADDMGLGKTM